LLEERQENWMEDASSWDLWRKEGMEKLVEISGPSRTKLKTRIKIYDMLIAKSKPIHPNTQGPSIFYDTCQSNRSIKYAKLRAS
jgi:hypothetical protein